MLNSVKRLRDPTNLRLLWPPSVSVLMASFSFNLVEIVGSLRPECLLVRLELSAFLPGCRQCAPCFHRWPT